MNHASTAAEERTPRLLIPDASPLSLLGMVGEEALDWLFVPGVEVWITDMVLEEVTRDPGASADSRSRHRATIHSWYRRNQDRIQVQTTDAGVEYQKAMRAWEMAGSPAELKPAWTGRGDNSILQALSAASTVVSSHQTAIALVDDRRVRAALMAFDTINIDLMATQSFIEWMSIRFHVRGADTAWKAIEFAAAGKAPVAPKADPVYIRMGP